MATGDEYDPEKWRQKRLKDFADEQRESAGVEIGRMARFYAKDDPRRGGQATRERKERDRLTSLLADAAYRAVFESVSEKIDAAERAVQKALEKAREHEAVARKNLEDLQERAAKLPDGRRVYRAEDGRSAYDETGRELSDVELSEVKWDKNNPTWEERQGTAKSLAEAEKETKEVERYGNDLARTKQRLNSGELSQKELEELDESFGKNMPKAVREEYQEELKADMLENRADAPRTGSAASHYLGGSGLDTDSSVSEAFNTAASGIRHTEELKPVPAPRPASPAPGLG